MKEDNKQSTNRERLVENHNFMLASMDDIKLNEYEDAYKKTNNIIQIVDQLN